MLTDDQARNLLHLAADTVEVRPDIAPETVRRRMWPLVAAAASVALIVGGGAALSHSILDQDQEPAKPASPGSECRASAPSSTVASSIPSGPDFPTNDRGLTYGSSGSDKQPDLISAVGNCGYTGYVYAQDLNDPLPWSEEAGFDADQPRTIPVYESDGVTQIDTFTIGAPSGGPDGGQKNSTGTQAVESQGVALDVPSDWVETSNGCEDNLDDQALYLHEPGARGGRGCGEVPSVMVLSTDRPAGRNMARNAPLMPGEVGGIPVRMGSSCSPTAACIYPNGTLIEAVDQGVLFLVASGTDAQNDPIVRSLRRTGNVDAPSRELDGPDASDIEGSWSVMIAGSTNESGTAQFDTFRDVALTATFSGDRLGVFDGCQDWTGTFDLVDREFALTEPLLTDYQGPACPDRTAPLADIVDNIRHVTVQGGEVFMHLDNYQIALVLTKFDTE